MLDAAHIVFHSGMIPARDINAFSLISREIQNAENFGGNSKEEGYTNMMDLRALILSAAPYCRETDNVLKALDEMVIYQVRGTNHTDTCGISVFYPYKVYGAEYMNTAAEICVSPYYLTFIDIQNQGIREGIKSAAALRFMAKLVGTMGEAQINKSREDFKGFLEVVPILDDVSIGGQELNEELLDRYIAKNTVGGRIVLIRNYYGISARKPLG